MKATSLKTAAILAGSISLLAGTAMAQTATTGVVGYNTWALDTGFNFVGVTLHETPLASGVLDSATATTVTDNEVDLGALITSGTYVLEIETAAGIIQEITSATGTALNTPSDISGVAVGASYTLRAASTLETVFGSAFTGSPDFGTTNGTLDSGLTIGYAGAAGADQIWFWNGTDFTEYLFDEFTEASGFASEGWVNLDNTAAVVDPTAINLIYADSFIITSASGNDVVVTGDLKSGATELNLGGGFNFVGSVAPVGANLETAFGLTFTGSPDFGTTNGTLDSGLAIGYAGAAGADQIWIWNGADFTEYLFDEFTEASGFASEGWVNLDNTAAVITASAVSLPTGYIVTAAGGKNVVQGVPSYYAGL